MTVLAELKTKRNDKLPDSVRRRVNKYHPLKESQWYLRWTASISGDSQIWMPGIFPTMMEKMQKQKSCTMVMLLMVPRIRKLVVLSTHFLVTRHNTTTHPQTYPGYVNYEGWASLLELICSKNRSAGNQNRFRQVKISQYFSALMVGFTEHQLNGRFVVTGTNAN